VICRTTWIETALFDDTARRVHILECTEKQIPAQKRRSRKAPGMRTIQIQIDSSAELPLSEYLAISFASGKGLLNAGSGEYEGRA
jgi:hypothetical protein